MCHLAVVEFFIENVEKEEFQGKKILEVGSKYVNGSVRPLIERFCSPREYLGVDIEPGKFVDLILPAEKLVEHFGFETFDVVIATELLEHVQDWRLVINNIKGVLKRGGFLYLTTRSFGFPFHSSPYDFWRYEIEDMKKIFSDFEILKLTRDREAPGVFLKARKPFDYIPEDIQNIAIYSMILGKRTISVPKPEDMPFPRKIKIKILTAKVLNKTRILAQNVLKRLLI
jgi:SAM-dependent methyltransferase